MTILGGRSGNEESVFEGFGCELYGVGMVSQPDCRHLGDWLKLDLHLLPLFPDLIILGSRLGNENFVFEGSDVSLCVGCPAITSYFVHGQRLGT